MTHITSEDLTRHRKIYDFVATAHDGQMRHGNVEPYYNHVKRVADNVVNHVGFSSDTIDIIAVALMHDVVEDTQYTFEQCFHYLKSQEAKDALVLLTKKKGESGDDYMNRLVSSSNRIALLVKYYDALDNAKYSEAGVDFIRNVLKQNPYKQQQKYLERAMMCSKALSELV